MIGCEALLLSQGRLTGIERYALEILKDATGPYSLIVGKGAQQEITQVATDKKWPIVQVPAGKRLIQEQILLGRHMKRQSSIDGIHYFSLSSGLVSSGHPFSLTIHDAVAWRFPQYLSRGMKYLYKPLIERAVRLPNFRGVVTVSNFSKDEISSVLGIPKSKIQVVYNKLSSDLGRAPSTSSKIFEGKTQFFLHVGTIEPRKNIESIVQAFHNARIDPGVKLVLVGRLGWGKLPDVDESVIHLDSVSDTDLADLYRNAQAVISASHYEGFGLPPAESLALGTPIIVRDIPVYRELFSEERNMVTFFRSHEELVDIMEKYVAIGRPRREKGFKFPVAQSFDRAINELYNQ